MCVYVCVQLHSLTIQIFLTHPDPEKEENKSLSSVNTLGLCKIVWDSIQMCIHCKGLTNILKQQTKAVLLG